MIDKKGQVTVEILLLIGFILLMSVSLAIIMSNSNELNTAMLSAREGACEGISNNGLTILPENSFKNYSSNSNKKFMLSPKNIKIIKIERTFKGKDAFNKTRIQLKVYASCPNLKTKEEKESLGESINYNIRKSITKSFKTENITNKLYNPAFSNSYSFTTAQVEWL